MQSIAHQRCYNHELREAVARCPECGRYFCRECITEHDDRALCSSCLTKLAAPSLVKRWCFSPLFRTAHCVVGILIVWLSFYLLGQALLALPSSFHEGAVWHTTWSEHK